MRCGGPDETVARTPRATKLHDGAGPRRGVSTSPLSRPRYYGPATTTLLSRPRYRDPAVRDFRNGECNFKTGLT